MSLSMSWNHLQEPGATPGKTQQSTAKFSCRVVCRPASRITPGSKSLTTGSGLRCHPRGNSESEVRPVGVVLSSCRSPPDRSAQASRAKPSQASVWLVEPTRVDGAHGGIFAVSQYSQSMKNPLKIFQRGAIFSCSTAAAFQPLPRNLVPDWKSSN